LINIFLLSLLGGGSGTAFSNYLILKERKGRTVNQRENDLEYKATTAQYSSRTT
jgi:hypothetical protein